MGENRGQHEAFVTLATNDTYSLGALVLANSLRRVGTTKQLVIMITSGVSPSMRDQLAAVYNEVTEVNLLDSSDSSNLELLGRPDLGVTFTKLHCWRLTQYKKCVFMDADTLVIKNIDDLLDREELSAAPDAGWPDCFNSGVFVYVPSEQTYKSLLTMAVSTSSFDGGDQGLLNMYFNKWSTEDIAKHLPFTYNVVSQAFYSYLPAFKQFFDNIKVVHFIGQVKPWHHAYNSQSGQVTVLQGTGHSQEFLQLWWNIFMSTVQPKLDTAMKSGLVGDLAKMHMDVPEGAASMRDDRERKLQWEQGQADYMGVDSFDNIKAKLDEKITPAQPKAVSKDTPAPTTE